MQQVTHHVFKAALSETLVDSTLNKFSQEPDKEIHTVPSVDSSVYIVLPIKDQCSADRARKDIYSLGAKIDVNVKPVFTSRKLSQTLSVKENKPPIVNTQCVVYLHNCLVFWTSLLIVSSLSSTNVMALPSFGWGTQMDGGSHVTTFK